MPNPNVPPGNLNRLRASILWNDFPELNVTASYLGKAGIRYALEGNTMGFIPVMTSVVQSAEPYLMFRLMVPLLKTQALSNSYKTQWESDSNLGQGTVRPDASALSPFNVQNCGIENVAEMSYGGDDPVMLVTIGGYYPANSAYWDM